MTTCANKTRNGQYYTLRSPFDHELFRAWVETIENIDQRSFAEPFGGANNILALSSDHLPGVSLGQWSSYDLEPEAIRVNMVPEVQLTQNDSLEHPVSADVMITNPPYLAKNSARRMGYHDVNFGRYNDLWERSLDVMLARCGHLAAIIPESFMTRGLFHERLFGVVSITESLFDDTDHPVCLALWLPEPQDDFHIYVADTYVGSYHEIHQQSKLLNTVFDQSITIRHNDPQGILGLDAVDSRVGPTIQYVRGDTIESSEVKRSSRHTTRISVVDQHGVQVITEDNLESNIHQLNIALATYRAETYDVFLTNFKTMRRDGVYRRRLDWNTSSLIIHSVLGSHSVSLFDTLM